jgi:hypothetical protein
MRRDGLTYGECSRGDYASAGQYAQKSTTIHVIIAHFDKIPFFSLVVSLKNGPAC